LTPRIVPALLYANLTTRKLSESPGGADFDWHELIEGDTLRFAETLGEEDIEIDHDVRTVRASLGRINARPAGGRWYIQIGSASHEDGVTFQIGRTKSLAPESDCSDSELCGLVLPVVKMEALHHR
jgi:hypothetical protein